MKIQQIVFSPTGGTQQVVDIMADEWGMAVDKIDLTNAETDFSTVNVEKNHIVLIAVPSYGGRVPAPAAERILQIRGNQARCVIVCVYGNRAYEDTLIELCDIAEESGFNVIAAASAIAEHSIMHQYAAGRPDTQDRNVLHNFAREILEKINSSSVETSALQIPGNRPYKKAGGASLVPKADHNCISCGLCEKKCPVKAISRDDLKTADSQKCISCMRCVVQCPQAARKVNKVMVSTAALALKKVCSVRKENELYI